MNITKKQLRRILKEFGSEEYGRQTLEFEPIAGIDSESRYSRIEITLYLQDLARSMARDGLDAGAIKLGLQDEFMDNFAGSGASYDDYSLTIDKLSQNPLLNENHSDDFSSWTAGDFAQAIRDYSKELTGRRDSLGSPDILMGMSREELSNYYAGMFNSKSMTASEDMHGHDDLDIEIDEFKPMAKHQGMGRRNETKRRLHNLLKEQLEIVHLSNLHDLDSGRELGHSSDNNNASMARGQLFHISKNAQSLHDKLHDDDTLPKWVQSKIAVMEDNMDAVFDYLTYQIHKEDN